jgi:hypothetical protein
MNSLTPAGVYQFITFLFLFDPRHNRNRGYITSLIYYQSSEGALHPLFRPESTAPKFPKHLGLDQLRSEPNRWYARNFVLLITSWLSLTSLARQLLPSWYEVRSNTLTTVLDRDLPLPAPESRPLLKQNPYPILTDLWL